MLNAKNNKKIKICILEMSSQNKAMLEFFFESSGSSLFQETNFDNASAFILDYDYPGAKESLAEISNTTQLPGILLSIKEAQEPNTVWLAKPITIKALTETRQKLADIKFEETQVKTTSEKSLETTSIAPTESLLNETIFEKADTPVVEEMSETVIDDKNNELLETIDTSLALDIPTIIVESEDFDLDVGETSEVNIVDEKAEVETTEGFQKITTDSDAPLVHHTIHSNLVEAKQSSHHDVKQDNTLLIPAISSSETLLEPSQSSFENINSVDIEVEPEKPQQEAKTDSFAETNNEIDSLLESLIAGEGNNKNTNNDFIEPSPDETVIAPKDEQVIEDVVEDSLEGSLEDNMLLDFSQENKPDTPEQKNSSSKSKTKNEAEGENNLLFDFNTESQSETLKEKEQTIDKPDQLIADFTENDDVSDELIYQNDSFISNEHDIDSTSQKTSTDNNLELGNDLESDNTLENFGIDTDNDIKSNSIEHDVSLDDLLLLNTELDKVTNDIINGTQNIEIPEMPQELTLEDQNISESSSAESIDIDNTMIDIDNSNTESIELKLENESEDLPENEHQVLDSGSEDQAAQEETISDGIDVPSDDENMSAEEELESLLEEIREEAEGISVSSSSANSGKALSGSSRVTAKRWVLTCGDNNISEKISTTYNLKEHMLSTLLSVIEQSKETKKVMRLKFNDIIIVIDSEVDSIYCDLSIFSSSYAEACFNKLSQENIKVHSLDRSEIRLYHKLFKEDPASTYSTEAFIWTTSLLTSRGRISEDTDLKKVVSLKYWPDLTRIEEIPHVMQIAAVFYKHPGSLIDIPSWLNIEERYVYAFYSAVASLKMIDFDNKKQKGSFFSKGSVTKNSNRNFFSRLLKRISSK